MMDNILLICLFIFGLWVILMFLISFLKGVESMSHFITKTLVFNLFKFIFVLLCLHVFVSKTQITINHKFDRSANTIWISGIK